jgi:hypothetical protein
MKRIESQADEMGAARAERTPQAPQQLPEEVEPTETIQHYDDEVPRRDIIREGGERPAQLPVRRPAAGPGGGGRVR